MTEHRHACRAPGRGDRAARPVDGGELAGDAGRRAPGTPVLAIHGITANHRCRGSSARRAAADAPLLAPDLRGRGGSRGLPAPYGLDRSTPTTWPPRSMPSASAERASSATRWAAFVAVRLAQRAPRARVESLRAGRRRPAAAARAARRQRPVAGGCARAGDRAAQDDLRLAGGLPRLLARASGVRPATGARRSRTTSTTTCEGEAPAACRRSAAPGRGGRELRRARRSRRLRRGARRAPAADRRSSGRPRGLLDEPAPLRLASGRDVDVDGCRAPRHDVAHVTTTRS